MRDGRFFRKPDFQLRDFGTSAPEASFSQNVSLSESDARHPVIVASEAPGRSSVEAAALGAGCAGGVAGWTSAIGVESGVAGFGVEAGAGVLAISTAGIFVVGALDASGLVAAAGAGVLGAIGFVASVRAIGVASGAALPTAAGASRREAFAGDADGWRAASSAAAATTHTAPTTIVRELIVHGEAIGFFVLAAFFDRIDRERFDFVKRSVSFLSDIFRSVRSAESR